MLKARYHDDDLQSVVYTPIVETKMYTTPNAHLGCIYFLWYIISITTYPGSQSTTFRTRQLHFPPSTSHVITSHLQFAQQFPIKATLCASCCPRAFFLIGIHKMPCQLHGCFLIVHSASIPRKTWVPCVHNPLHTTFRFALGGTNLAGIQPEVQPIYRSF
jgi:hypothetical protein